MTDHDQPARSIQDLPTPRAPGGEATPSQASVGAMDIDPTADRSDPTPLPDEVLPLSD